MTDRPVIFSNPMVLALLDGRKTQTRRLAWGGPIPGLYESDGGPLMPILRATPWQKVQMGDRLWVRERCYADPHLDAGMVWAFSEDNAMAQGANGAPVPWGHGTRSYCPSIHMPRFISRLTLVVTEVRRQQLQDISGADVKAEGLAEISKDDGRTWKFGIPDRDGLPGPDDHGWPWKDWNADAPSAFRLLWESLHGANSWDANPELVALSFEVHRCNIDQMPCGECNGHKKVIRAIDGAAEPVDCPSCVKPDGSRLIDNARRLLVPGGG